MRSAPLPAMLGRALLAVVALCGNVPVSRAAHVGPGQQYVTIAAAINGSTPGEPIIVSPGIYSEPRLNIASRTLTSTQPTQPGATVIQNTDGRAVIQASDATIEGFTIAGGRNSGGHGGGVALVGGDVILRHLIIVQNTAGSGGGVGGNTGGATVRIEDCTISNNTATNRGGGVEGPPGRTTIVDSVIKDNVVANGSPTGIGAGGGVFLPMFSTASIAATEITANQAFGTRYGSGGGIHSNANLSLSGVKLQTNTALPGTGFSRGGGLFLSRQGRSNVHAGSVSGNTAGKGGGIYVSSGNNVVIISTPVSGNTATQPLGSGGGIFCGGPIQSLGGKVSGNMPDQIVGCGPDVIPPIGTTQTGGDNRQGGDTNDPVSTRTGELFNPYAPDLDLRGPMPLFFARYYSSIFKQVGIFAQMGDNWRHNFDWKLTSLDDTIHILDHRGRTIQFVLNGARWDLTGKTDVPFQLTENAGLFTLLDPQDRRTYLFDEAGLLLGIADGRGNGHALSYANGPLTQVSDGLGRVINFTYGDDGNLSSVDDGLGRSVLFTYTGTYLTGVTDLNGETTIYNYSTANANLNGWGLFTTMVRPEGNTPFEHRYWFVDRRSSSELDSNGHQTIFRYPSPTETTITDPLGNVRTHTHTATGELSGSTDHAGRNVALGSDATGRRNSVTDRFGDLTTTEYHGPSGQPASRVHPDGATTSFSYNARAIGDNTAYDLTGVVHADLTTESFDHDALGNPISHVDRLGVEATLTYNAWGQPLTASNRLGGVVTLTYHADATPATHTDPAGNPTSYDYDALRRLDLVTFADANTIGFTYDNADRLRSTTDENGEVTTINYDRNGNIESLIDPMHGISFSYDGNDRLLTITDDLGGVSSRTYDELGRVGTTTDPMGNLTTYGYDIHSRLTTLTDPLLKTWSNTHDLEGVIASHTDPLLNTTTFRSDTMGRITEIRSPLGHASTFTYDAMGRTSTSTDALGRTTTVARDARGLPSRISLPGDAISASYARNEQGRITELTDPNDKRWQASYDTSGRLTSRTDPLLQSTGLTYDNRNRLSVTTFPGGLGTETRTYDPTGNLTNLSSSDGLTLSYSYDALNRLTSAHSGGPDNVTRSYDAADRLEASNGITITRDLSGRITFMTLAPGKIVGYLYDANDRLTTVSDWAGGMITFDYDDAGRLTGIARQNGVNTTHTWDNDSRLTGIDESGVSNIALTLDAHGQITAATRNVPQVASPSPDNNRTYSFDAAAQIVGATYDALGRLTADGGNTFTWDLASRLTSYSVGGAVVSNGYDALGRRTSRTVVGTTREFIWNDALILESISVEREAGADLNYYIHTPGGELLYRIDAATNARSFYHYDEMGNTVFVSNDAGAVVGSHAYTPYGEALGSSGARDNLFTWRGRTGAIYEGNGLYSIRARYYDSTSGRFLSRDPVEQTDPRSTNPYQYAWDNPLLYLDPSGKDPFTRQELERLQKAVEEAEKRLETKRKRIEAAKELAQVFKAAGRDNLAVTLDALKFADLNRVHEAGEARREGTEEEEDALEFARRDLAKAQAEDGIVHLVLRSHSFLTPGPGPDSNHDFLNIDTYPPTPRRAAAQNPKNPDKDKNKGE